jgi:hypothetical protein
MPCEDRQATILDKATRCMPRIILPERATFDLLKPVPDSGRFLMFLRSGLPRLGNKTRILLSITSNKHEIHASNSDTASRKFQGNYAYGAIIDLMYGGCSKSITFTARRSAPLALVGRAVHCSALCRPIKRRSESPFVTPLFRISLICRSFSYLFYFGTYCKSFN